MKKIFLLLGLFIGFLTFAQVPATHTNGVKMGLKAVEPAGGVESQIYYNSSTNSYFYHNGTGFVPLSITNTSQLINDGSNTFNTYLTNDDVYQGNAVLKGNYFWTGTGYNYYAEASDFIINNVRYTQDVVADPVTLAAADPTNDRFDLLVVNSNLTITAITGTASADPIVPDIDEETQVVLGIIFVTSNTTTPVGVSNELVYDENLQVAGGEWNTAVINANVTLGSTNDAESGTTSVEFVSASSGDGVQFTNDVLSDGIQLSNLVFRIKITNNPGAGQRYRIGLGISTIPAEYPTFILEDGEYGFDTSNTTTFQTIVIPSSAFSIGNTQYDRLFITNLRTNASAFIDGVVFQEGTTPTVVQGSLQTVSEVGNTTTLPLIADSFIKDGATNDDVLLGDGTTTSLGTLSASPAGANNQIQINDNGSFGASNLLEAEFVAGVTHLIRNGSDDVTNGQLFLYGGATTNGGRIALFTSADNDTNEDNYQIAVDQTNLIIGTQSSGGARLLFGDDEDVISMPNVSATEIRNSVNTFTTIPTRSYLEAYTIGASAYQNERYTFNSSLTGLGNTNLFGFNNADPTLATNVWINDATGAVDNSTLLATYGVGDLLYFFDEEVANIFTVYEITGTPVDQVGYYDFPVTLVDDGGGAGYTSGFSYRFAHYSGGSASTPNLQEVTDVGSTTNNTIGTPKVESVTEVLTLSSPNQTIVEHVDYGIQVSTGTQSFLDIGDIRPQPTDDVKLSMKFNSATTATSHYLFNRGERAGNWDGFQLVWNQSTSEFFFFIDQEDVDSVPEFQISYALATNTLYDIYFEYTGSTNTVESFIVNGVELLGAPTDISANISGGVIDYDDPDFTTNGVTSFKIGAFSDGFGANGDIIFYSASVEVAGTSYSYNLQEGSGFTVARTEGGTGTLGAATTWVGTPKNIIDSITDDISGDTTTTVNSEVFKTGVVGYEATNPEDFVTLADLTKDINVQSADAGYTFVLSDAENIVRYNGVAGDTFTVPENTTTAFPLGTSITVMNTSAATLTIAGTGSSTVNQNVGGLTLAQYDKRILIKYATDLWILGY